MFTADGGFQKRSFGDSDDPLHFFVAQSEILACDTVTLTNRQTH
jgi:hypothetical protein